MSPEQNPSNNPRPSEQEAWQQLHQEMQVDPNVIDPRLQEYASAKFAEHGIDPTETDAAPVHDALGDISQTESVIIAGSDMDDEPPSAVRAEVAAAVTYVAEKSIERHTPDEDQKVMDAVVAGVTISEPGPSNPIDVLVRDGHEDEVVSAVKTLAAEGAYGTAEAVAHEIDDAEKVTDAIDTDRFLNEKLKRHEIVDDDGFKRDVYEINSQKIMFRNRDELPKLAGIPYIVVDRNLVPPTELTSTGITTENLESYAGSSIATVGKDAIVMVTNTPEGILKAAIDAGADQDGNMQKMVNEITQGNYSHEALELIDTILATTQYTDEGPSEIFAHEGFAVVLAALQGDSDAQKIVDKKATLLHEHESEQHQEVDNSGETPLNPDKLVLVHSTQYPIGRDEQGNVFLAPSGALRSDKLPRSTIHFTINGQVESHAYGSWDNSNKLIVTNFAKVVQENGSPRILNSADTYYCLNPGQKLVLPDAIIVSGHSEQTELIDVTDSGDVTYGAKESYSEDDKRKIMKLAEDYGIKIVESASDVDVLREVALRIAETKLGADTFNVIGEWGADYDFDKSLKALAREIGSGAGPHSSLPEGQLEAQIKGGFASSGGQTEEYVTFGGGVSGVYRSHYSLIPKADIRAKRYVVAAGYMPARDSYSGAVQESDHILL